MMYRQDKIHWSESERTSPVYAFLNQFFQAYFLERDREKTLSMLSQQLISVGTGEEEVATDRAAFQALLDRELEALPYSMLYQVSHFHQRPIAPDRWDCFCIVELHFATLEGVQMRDRIRITASLHQEGEHFLIDMIHASEGSLHQEEGEFLPLKFVSSEVSSAPKVSRKTQQELLEIVAQVMPGGIIGTYILDGFPLYLTNQRLLDMAGYHSYREFYQDAKGLLLNNIHPEDRDFVKREITRSLGRSDQYELEYRMRRKDGSYFWVHDIGRPTVTRDGQAAIIRVLVDISHQIDLRHVLLNEVVRDSLTQVYNRKGGYNRIARDIQNCGRYLFFMVDLDNFKQVNDIYGHEQGDRVLCYITKLLINATRKSDTVFRLGGDEFGVFIPNCPAESVVEHKLKTIISDYEAAMQAYWPRAHSSLSVGGIYGRLPRSFTQLYQLADEMLYQMKKGEKGNFLIRSIPEDE